MRVWTTLGLLMLVACGGGEGRYGADGDGEGAERPEPVTVVETAAAALGEVADRLQTSAIVESERQADLVPATTGRVLDVRVDDGDPVAAGDVLAVLENVTLDASATRASAEARRLVEQVAEMEALHTRGAVSDKELEDIRFQLRTAQVSASEATRSFGQTRLTAPFDGVVASRTIRVGELASSATPAFQVVDLEALRVVASMPERDLPRVAVGQPAKLTSAYDDSRSSEGTIARVAPVVDPSSGTFRVTIEVDPEQTALRPGQFVTIDLEVDRRRDVLTVPKRAIVYEDGAPVVYVVGPPDAEDEGDEADGEEAEAGWWPPSWLAGDDDDDEPEEAEVDDGPALVARRTPVRLGLVDEHSAEILAGLEAGAEVIVLGQAHLRDGARVRPPRTDDEDVAAAEDVE